MKRFLGSSIKRIKTIEDLRDVVSQRGYTDTVARAPPALPMALPVHAGRVLEASMDVRDSADSGVSDRLLAGSLPHGVQNMITSTPMHDLQDDNRFQPLATVDPNVTIDESEYY